MEHYNFRNLPCTIREDGDLWYVSGVYDDGILMTSGVLEWCYDEADAKYHMNKMENYGFFSRLCYGKFNEMARN